jgi:hypothetical protein
MSQATKQPQETGASAPALPTSTPPSGKDLPKQQSQPAQLPADQHFVRMVVLAQIQGRSFNTMEPLTESRVQTYIRVAQMALGELKKVEQQ